jgi:hypothetical protein
MIVACGLFDRTSIGAFIMAKMVNLQIYDATMNASPTLFFGASTSSVKTVLSAVATLAVLTAFYAG